MVEREERIRSKAQALWEADGRPQGRTRSYWDLAAQLVDEEDQAAAREAVDPGQAASTRADVSATNDPVGVTLNALRPDKR